MSADSKPAVAGAARPSVLYAAFMPLLRNGGIFIPTTRA